MWMGYGVWVRGCEEDTGHEVERGVASHGVQSVVLRAVSSPIHMHPCQFQQGASSPWHVQIGYKDRLVAIYNLLLNRCQVTNTPSSPWQLLVTPVSLLLLPPQDQTSEPLYSSPWPSLSFLAPLTCTHHMIIMWQSHHWVDYSLFSKDNLCLH